MYKVIVSGKEIGYVESKKALVNTIYDNVKSKINKNVEIVYAI